MKWNKLFSKKPYSVAWQLFGIANLILTTAFLFIPDFNYLFKMFPLLLRILFVPGLLLCFTGLGFFIVSRKRKIVIHLDHTTVEILEGNCLFEDGRACYDGYNVITVSELFSSKMGKYVSKNTTHYQFIKEIVGNNVDRFEKEMQKGLSDKIPQNIGEKPKRYPLGTTAVVNFGNEKYFFIAIVQKDNEFRCIPTSIKDFLKVLDELWKIVRVENEDFPVNMTLIGSGRAGVKMSLQHILQTILMSLYYESQEGIVVKKLRIILDKNKMNAIDLEDIKSYWDTASQKKLY